jgi:hypothetical protein
MLCATHGQDNRHFCVTRCHVCFRNIFCFNLETATLIPIAGSQIWNEFDRAPVQIMLKGLAIQEVGFEFTGFQSGREK